MARVVWLAGLAMLTASLTVAQKGVPAGTGGGTTSGGTGGGNTSTMPTTSAPTNSSTTPGNSPSQQRPIFLNGQVLMEEGGAPPDRVSIERVCPGGTYREGYTDSKGYFNLQLGSQTTMFADASMDTAPMIAGMPTLSQQNNGGSQNNSSMNNLFGCELRATLPGFHSESVSLSSRRALDNGDVGIIILQRMVKVDGYTTSATIALAPKDAKKAYEKGLNFEKKMKPDEAQTEFLHAVEVDPRHAGAWFELGKVYEQRDHADQARDAYHKAITADGNFVNPYERLYLLAVHDSQWTDAADISEKVLRLNPYEFPDAYYYNALANIQLKKWDAAEKSARESAKIKGVHAMPKSLFLLGFVQANKGDLPGSVQTLHNYLQTGPDSGDRARAQKLLGQVEQDLAARNQTATAPPQ